MDTQNYYQTVLLREFEQRKKTNPRYSLRAYAKFLGVTIATISRVLSGKRELTVSRADSFVQILNLSATEKKKFIHSVVAEKKRAKKESAEVQILTESYSSIRKIDKLNQEMFESISTWHHYAILQLTTLDSFKPNIKWISDRLGISELLTKEAIQRLEKLGLLIIEEDGTYRKTSKYLVHDDLNTTRTALKNHQQQFLEASLEALKNVPLEERSHSSYMIAIDPKKIPRLKEFITEFAADVSEIGSEDAKKRLYWLGISLFPLDQKTETQAITKADST